MLVHRLTIMEKNQEWDSPHSILAWSQGVSVSVDFCDCDISFLRNGMKDRRDHFARATPRGPEIYQHPF